MRCLYIRKRRLQQLLSWCNTLVNYCENEAGTRVLDPERVLFTARAVYMTLSLLQ